MKKPSKLFGQFVSLKGEIWICQHCGKPYEPNRPNQKWCSERCGHLGRGEQAEKLEKICAFCGETFLAYQKNTVYCSDKCRRQAYRKTRGLNLNKRFWQNLREFVLERDNYTCQDCGKFLMDIGLAVHHIKPLYKGGNNNETNLISLCHKCHKKRHMKWAYRGHF